MHRRPNVSVHQQHLGRSPAVVGLVQQQVSQSENSNLSDKYGVRDDFGYLMLLLPRS